MLWDFSMFSMFLTFSIITYKHGIYELSHEFPND